MNRDLAVAVAIAAVGILAVAVAAATLPAVVTEGPVGGGGADGNGSGLLPVREDPSQASDWEFEIPPIVRRIALVLSGLGMVLAMAWAVWNLRDALTTVLLVVAAFAVLAGLFLLLDAVLGGSGSGPAFAGPGNTPIPGEGGSGSAGAGPLLPVIGGLVLLLAVIAFVGATGNRTASPDREPIPDLDDDVPDQSPNADRSRRAGRDGDGRLSADEAAENGVYRSWRAMTRTLSTPRRAARTPGEYAAAAVREGFTAPAVRELTNIFEAVRYGGRSPHDGDREERAAAALERMIAARENTAGDREDAAGGREDTAGDSPERAEGEPAREDGPDGATGSTDDREGR